MKTLAILLALSGTTHAAAYAVVIKAPYTRARGIDPYLSGVALLNGDQVTNAHLTWHGPNYQLIGDSGTWDGSNLSVSGRGCTVDHYPAECVPTVPMAWSNVDGLDIDGVATDWDLQAFVARQVPIGDSTVDGVFDSQDMVAVFQAGLYENNWRTAYWNDGDWNLDGQFDSADMVAAFAEGGYESAAAAIPEPTSALLLLMGAALAYRERVARGRRRR